MSINIIKKILQRTEVFASVSAMAGAWLAVSITHVSWWLLKPFRETRRLGGMPVAAGAACRNGLQRCFD
ncbi:hypothetical protein [Ralstonia mannitolilytica]|uniref:hypothetical protein n=1 Tax=Ralstonia mannitolilytica TaxID=105219 RepID=UPI0014257A00|nr:hypothetical protein [Ralstonia mannitolilytica]MBY4716663.1 hypothetical protein [Ralstonia mannitolilytica]